MECHEPDRVHVSLSLPLQDQLRGRAGGTGRGLRSSLAW